MKILTRAALAFILVLGCTTAALADDSSFSDIQRILNNKKLRVAIVGEDAPPMIVTDENGAPAGFEVDLAGDIGKKLGVEVEFIRTAQTFDEVIDLVSQKKADIGVSFLTAGVGRAKLVLFSRPYISQKRRAFFNRAAFASLKSKFPIETLEDVVDDARIAGSLKAGAVEGSIYEEILKKDLAQFQRKMFPDLPELVTAVKEGQIFAGIHGELLLRYYMQQNPETAIYVAIEPKVRYLSDVSIAVRPDSPNLLRWIDIYLASYVGRLDTEELLERYDKAREGSEQ